MPQDFQDKVKIQSGLGFTREQIDLAEYNLIKISKAMKEKKYQEEEDFYFSGIFISSFLIRISLILIESTLRKSPACATASPSRSTRPRQPPEPRSTETTSSRR
jgi:hypothetical protein